VDGDEVNQWIRSVASPALVARMDHTDETLRKYHEREVELQTEFDSLPIDEVRNRVAGALSSAAELLRNTPISGDLKSHGWTPAFAGKLVEECDRLRDLVEHDTYPREWGGYGLGRSILEQIDPTTTDSFKKAIYHAGSYLKAMSAWEQL
jgi:hypothetical protein